MIVNITSKQMDITPAIREHIESRLAKLDKWQVSLISPMWCYRKSLKVLWLMPT